MMKRFLSVAAAMGTALVAMAQLSMDVNTKKLGAPIQSTMYGIFFEDINYAAGGGPNCPDPGAGFYQINLDAAAMTYNLLKIESISMIGGFNGWGEDLEMTYNTTDGCWEVTTDAVSGEYKFRANHDWAINWGGSENNLTEGGGNLNIDAGTYTFQLFISYTGNNRVVITKK